MAVTGLSKLTFWFGNKMRCLFSSTAHEEKGSEVTPSDKPNALMASRRVQGFDISNHLKLKISTLKVTNV
jgi:hypothetical protein